MSLKPYLAIVLLIGACKGSSSSSSPAPSGSAAVPAGEPALAPVADLSTLPLAAVHDTVGGQAFTVALPSGVKRRVENDYVVFEISRGTVLGADPDVSFTKVATPTPLEQLISEGAVLSTPAEPRRVARQEADADHALATIIADNHQYIEIHGWARLGDRVVSCSYSQRSPQPIVAFDAVRAWGEKICLSLKVDAS